MTIFFIVTASLKWKCEWNLSLEIVSKAIEQSVQDNNKQTNKQTFIHSVKKTGLFLSVMTVHYCSFCEILHVQLILYNVSVNAPKNYIYCFVKPSNFS